MVSHGFQYTVDTLTVMAFKAFHGRAPGFYFQLFLPLLSYLTKLAFIFFLKHSVLACLLGFTMTNRYAYYVPGNS